VDNLQHTETDNFLDETPKEKLEKVDSIKIKNFCTSKILYQKSERPTHRMVEHTWQSFIW
jgi:hypothetical protein